MYSKGPVIESDLSCDQGFTKAPNPEMAFMSNPMSYTASQLFGF